MSSFGLAEKSGRVLSAERVWGHGSRFCCSVRDAIQSDRRIDRFLLPGIVGAATAVFATIVHLWAKRNRKPLYGELPEYITVPEDLNAPASELPPTDEARRVSDELKEP